MSLHIYEGPAFSADRFRAPTLADEQPECESAEITVEQVIEAAGLMSWRRVCANRPVKNLYEQDHADAEFARAERELLRLVRNYGLQCYRAGLSDMDGVS